MKMTYRTAVFLGAALVAAAGFAGNEAASAGTISYRGRFINGMTGEEVEEFDRRMSKNLTFLGYGSDAAGATPVWSGQVPNVKINPNGTFEAVFGDADLAGHIATGAVTHIGMKVGTTTTEVGAPRAFRPVVSVNHALAAEGLAPNAKVGILLTTSAAVGTMDVASAEIAGTLSVSNSADIAVRPFAVDSGVTRIRKGKGVKVWGEPRQLSTSSGTVRAKDTLATAPSDGVALVHCVSSGYGRDLPIPGTIQFCRKGDSIVAPTWTSENVRVTFWPYVEAK